MQLSVTSDMDIYMTIIIIIIIISLPSSQADDVQLANNWYIPATASCMIRFHYAGNLALVAQALEIGAKVV